MLVTVFHASLHKIDKFEIPYQGLHFGSFESALQAVERKCEQNGTDEFYLHRVLLDITTCEDVFDAGEDWRGYLDGDTNRVYSYTNKYEPSISKSYVIFSTRFIKSIESLEQLSTARSLNFT